jgi:hypothetical protein
MKIFVLAVFISLFFATLCLAEVPDFDIKKYCTSVAEMAGGSYSIESSCREMEEDSKKKLVRRTVSARIMKYCKDVASYGGNSYMILESCIDMEEDARKGLD